ncbi:MAG TPA: hypothetical protein ENI61_00700 [Ignavibacteria bacterium]|nr:hypothetical protein [Ignavibacteria bacterium]
MGLLLVFMILVIGFAFLTPIANVSNLMSEKQVVTNENQSLSSCYGASATGTQVNESSALCNITVTNAPTGWRLTNSQCALGSVVITNSTETKTFVAGTDYTLFAQQGIVKMLNTTSTTGISDNLTTLDYNYCNQGYATDSASRSLTKLWATLMIIVLLVVVIAFVIEQFKLLE